MSSENNPQHDNSAEEKDTGDARHDSTPGHARRNESEASRTRKEQKAPKTRRAPKAPDEPDSELAEAEASGDEQRVKKIHVGFRVYGVLCLIGGILLAATDIGALVLIGLSFAFGKGGWVLDALASYSAASYVIMSVQLVVSVALAIMYIKLGWRLLHNNRHRAGTLAYTMIAFVIVGIICDIMLDGISPTLLLPFFNLVMMIVISTFVDPSLVQERQLQRKLREMETRKEAEAGGRDETGRGYITLNFFNLFWLFVVACIAGLVVEDLFRLVTAGVYEDRAGLLYGPFSPIYGFGAVLMTVALNRFYKKNVLLIFAVSAVIGGAFEYLVSWFMQFAFGIKAWDYSGPWFNADGSINLISFMNIDGRTSLIFMIFWGLLGVVWIKLMLPGLLKLINLIPWNWRYAVTTVGAILMLIDGAMTLIALDCWYERVAGNEPTETLELYCAKHFDNEYMENRFQTMTIDASTTSRTNFDELIKEAASTPTPDSSASSSATSLAADSGADSGASSAVDSGADSAASLAADSIADSAKYD